MYNDQVALGVKQRKPNTIEAAVRATLDLELESYQLVQHSSPGMVAPVQVDYMWVKRTVI